MYRRKPEEKAFVLARFEISVCYLKERKSCYTSDYLTAYEIYKMFVDLYPSDAEVDIIDLTTGEVYKCND